MGNMIFEVGRIYWLYVDGKPIQVEYVGGGMAEEVNGDLVWFLVWHNGGDYRLYDTEEECVIARLKREIK